MSRPPRWIVIVLVIAVVVPVAWGVFVRVTQPDDPPAFYDPPDALPAGGPGTIIRSHDVDTSVDARVQRVLYTSTGADGDPIAVSAVVVAPTGAAPAGGWPVVAWAHGTSGIASNCAPSLDPDAGLGKIPELDRLLAAGTVVVATDYPGLGTPGPHPYLIGESEGRAVLDSVRAVHSVLGDDVSATTAVYGHSQGGHATVYAAELAPTYAPELDIVGVAPMAPPTDLATLVEDDDHEAIGILLTALAIGSWSAIYPEADESAVVHTGARPFVHEIGENCVSYTAQGIADLPDIVALQLRFLSADPATAPGWSDIMRDNAAAGTTIKVPVLVAQGLTDDLVRPDVTRAWVERQCTDGAVIELHTYAGVGHFEVRTTAAPAVADWLTARLTGSTAPPTSCSTIES
ncbi:MAG: alpha/beta fold hydrolase [Ilumatobacteraceae bacterium]